MGVLTDVAAWVVFCTFAAGGMGMITVLTDRWRMRDVWVGVTVSTVQLVASEDGEMES